ncbi:hypothetical protein GALMADRAFT_1074994 [Galerina marginata CBS 339.88]|uniref:Uncharacterized protein n=1 Tax=Galerina marginata (strain CBS 339.88) TaxID=685588 RepID=A0A067SJ08_GALM3|nr:hypothetical protein GALMADRAFT_1074994 [Galerina marginata CBS 339.88]
MNSLLVYIRVVLSQVPRLELSRSVELDCPYDLPISVMTSPVDNPQLTNPDIQGFAVRLSSFITQACVALLIAYSTKPQRYPYFPLFLQQALIIFSIWLCRGRNQLSLSDLDFAIVQTRSPVSIYVLLLIIPRLFLEKAVLKKDCPTKDRRSFFRCCLNLGDLDWGLMIHRICGLFYGLCCLSINLVRDFENGGYTHFTESKDQPGLNRLEGRPNVNGWFGQAACSLFIYECVLHRHGQERREIMHQLAGTRKKSFTAQPLSKRIRWGFAATWFVVTRLHPWLPFLYVLIMFLNWSLDMRIWTIEEDFEWSYGQLLAILQIVLLYPCMKLCYSRRREIAALPQRLVLDIIWLVSGKGQAWTTAAQCDLILKNSWNAFPPDVPTENPGLPLADPNPSTGATNPPAEGIRVRIKRSRRRRTCSMNRGERPDNRSVHVEEEDIVDYGLGAEVQRAVTHPAAECMSYSPRQIGG